MTAVPRSRVLRCVFGAGNGTTGFADGDTDTRVEIKVGGNAVQCLIGEVLIVLLD